MSNTGKSKLFPQENLIPIAFLLTGLYWFYLAFTSQMIITSDAIGYETLGKMFHQKGLLEYFKTGPNREPLYPLLVSLSMRAADLFHVPYQSIQKPLQVLILLITQLLTLKILNKLKVRCFLQFICLLYIGFSPAIVNSAFSLYSEIAAYPFVLLIVLLAAKIFSGDRNPGPFYLVGLTAACIAVISIKAAFIGILAVAFFPYMLSAIKNRRWRPILILYGTVIAFLLTMASLNQLYNGHFTFTDRGDRAFYVAVALRTEGINKENLSYALRIQPHLEFSQRGEDLFTAERLALKNQGLSERQIDTKIYSVGIQKILHNPFSYLFFYTLQVIKMFFWESTRIGFVAYPEWLASIFDCRPLEIALHIVSGLLAFVSLLYTVRWIKTHGKISTHKSDNRDQRHILLTTMIMMIIPYTLFYSFSIVLPRFLLPIIPAYLILTAFFLDDLVQTKT